VEPNPDHVIWDFGAEEEQGLIKEFEGRAIL
jgi:hypothetical protein